MTPLSIPILLHKPDQKRNKTIQRCQNQNTLHPKIPIVEHPQNIFSQPIIQSEVSQKEKHQHSILTHILTMPKPLTVWMTINCGKF